jgi:hypothetical protein
VGVAAEKGEERQVIFANKLVKLAAKARIDDNTARKLALDHMGDELRTFVSNKGPTTLQEIQSVLLHLTPADIRKIRKEVRREAELAAMRSQFSSAALSRPLAPFPPSRFNTPQQSPPQANNNVTYSTGPFPNTPDGWTQYKEACRSFYLKYGDGAQSGVAKPYPLTPGSLPVASGECWACGATGHAKPDCTTPTKLPPNEQRYRSLAALQRRNNPQTGQTNQPTNRPWRAMGYDYHPSPYASPYDTAESMTPTAYSPVQYTPYDYPEQGNGGEPEW